jgi:hypothetical protein
LADLRLKGDWASADGRVFVTGVAFVVFAVAGLVGWVTHPAEWQVLLVALGCGLVGPLGIYLSGVQLHRPGRPTAFQVAAILVIIGAAALITLAAALG